MGKGKIWSLAIAHDVVILAEPEGGLKEATKRLEKFLDRRGLELNEVERKQVKVSWKGQEIELVKE